MEMRKTNYNSRKEEAIRLPQTRKQMLPFDYAWIILAVLFLALLASFGVRASFGAYITPWEHDFSVDRSVVTSISMLSFIVFAFAQPLAGKLNDHLGGRIVPSVSMLLVGGSLLLASQATDIWQLFIYYGVGISLGIAGCSNVIAAAIVTRWFAAKRGFALGLAVSGMAVGQLIVVPATLFLINQYSWRIAMMVVSLIILVVFVPLLFIFVRSKPEEAGLQPYGATTNAADNACQFSRQVNPVKTASIFAVVKQRTFWQLTIPYFMCGFTDVGLIQTHLIPLAQGKQFSVSIVALTFSTIAIFNILGTITTGYMSDHFHRSRQLSFIYAVRALTLLFLFSISSPWLLIPFAVIYGATEMASIAPTSSLTAHLFEQYSIGTMLGFVSVSHQIGGAFGSWVPGLLFDLTGSYSFILILSAVLLMGSAVLVLYVPEPRSVLR
jgi:MFS family permease